MKRITTHSFAKRTGAFLLAAMLLMAPGSALPVFADAEHSEFAKSSELSKEKQIMKYGMTPISPALIKDGSWDIEVQSSSSFFRVHSCELVVAGGEMTAKLTMETYSYPLLYLGTGAEAAAAPYEDYIEYEEIDDWYVFTVPVKALNMPIDCASFSKKKKKWYDRKLLFDATSLPAEALDGFEMPDYDLIQSAMESEGVSIINETNTTSENTDTTDNTAPYSEPVTVEDMDDGRYSINVALTGGSGRASVSTPTLMIVKDGKAYVELLWSSPNYDWMQVGGVTYTNEAEEGGNSVFTIPVPSFDSVVPIIADTTAMGDPVAIHYSLTFYEESIGDEGLIPQIAAKKVVIFAVIIIVAGFFLNLIVKKKRRR